MSKISRALGAAGEVLDQLPLDSLIAGGSLAVKWIADRKPIRLARRAARKLRRTVRRERRR